MSKKNWKRRTEGLILGLALGLMLGRLQAGHEMGQVMEQGFVPFSIEEKETERETETLVETKKETEEATEPVAEVFATGPEITELMNEFFLIPEGMKNSGNILTEESKLLKTEPIDRSVEGPQILIYHTHSQEAFADSEPGNTDHSVIGIGNRLAMKLSEMGFRVYHDLGNYDLAEDGLLERNRSYERALPKLEELLEKYPGIQLVIDVHRDGVAEDIRLVTEVEGKETARIMFVNGVEEGNPYLEQNLALSLQLIQKCKEVEPEFARSIYIKSGNYNQHLCPSILLEVGAQTSTVAEAQNAVDIFGEILGKILFG